MFTLVITVITDNMSYAVISTINVILIMRFLVGLQGMFRSVGGLKLLCSFYTEEESLLLSPPTVASGGSHHDC